MYRFSFTSMPHDFLPELPDGMTAIVPGALLRGMFVTDPGEMLKPPPKTAAEAKRRREIARRLSRFLEVEE
jgi:hypothetical protein